jgi:hypothetical protein
MIFPYLFFILFSSFLAESHGADCPSKKLWKKEDVTVCITIWCSEQRDLNQGEGLKNMKPWSSKKECPRG